jgi:hypothetical protein
MFNNSTKCWFWLCLHAEHMSTPWGVEICNIVCPQIAISPTWDWRRPNEVALCTISRTTWKIIRWNKIQKITIYRKLYNYRLLYYYFYNILGLLKITKYRISPKYLHYFIAPPPLKTPLHHMFVHIPTRESSTRDERLSPNFPSNPFWVDGWFLPYINPT